MKNKYIYLNALVTVPSLLGEEKIEKATQKDEYKINYESLGIRPPKGEAKYDEEGRVILEDDDLEDITVPLTIPTNNLDSWVSSVDGGTVVYTKSRIQYTVVEEIWEIDAFLEMVEMSWIERNWLLFVNFFAEKQIKNKVQK